MRILRLSAAIRYVLLAGVFAIGLHTILSFSNDNYGQATSLSNIASNMPWSAPKTIPPKPVEDNDTTDTTPVVRANATILMLARNSEKDAAVRSIAELETKWNYKYEYPWIFLNEEPFSEEFKLAVSNATSGRATFGQIPHDHWFQPDWIDEVKANGTRQAMETDGIVYGGSLSYRNMCRFNSGFFFRHPLLQGYKWYWRVEPNVRFPCDINLDPFRYMEQNNKLYAFTITIREFNATIATLWDTVKDFVHKYPEYLSPDNSMNFLSDDGGQSYNLCHFWSNFEIADMDFWRSEAYTKFFEYLDSTGGFYYERWGDAPVHSIAAGLLARKDQIYFFDDIGYEHPPFTHCPRGRGKFMAGNCTCRIGRAVEHFQHSCIRQWDRIQ